MATDSAATTPRRRPATSARGTELRQERALRTRESILRAAAEAFADHGFPGVTILDVAELTGVTKGAVYFHFTNKEALAVAVAEEFYRRLAAVTVEIENVELPALQAVTELVLRTAIAFRDDKTVQAGARLQLERSFIDATLPTPYLNFGNTLTRLLVKAGADGQLPDDSDPEVLSRVLSAAFFGTQHISWVLNNRADLRERTHELLDALLPGSAPVPAC
jgi:AcrR family transcriptional regulator